MTAEDKKVLYSFLVNFNIPTEYVVVARYESMSFIIHPNENCGHHKAHVHIKLSDGEELELGIEDAQIMNYSKKFPPKKIKLAQKFVQENQGLFVRNWNEFTNGVSVTLEESA